MPTQDILDLKNKKVGTISLAEDVWAAPLRRYILAEAVHWHRAKRRAGTHSTKTKAEVNGTTKKPYKQKGTGNARQGSMKNPQMVGGGRAFGPTPRSHDYTFPKTKRRVALATALSMRLGEGNVRVVKDFDLSEIKTKSVVTALAALGAKKALIVDTDNENLFRSARNIPSSRYLNASGINVYEILKYPGLIITERAVKAIEARLVGDDA